MEPLTHALTSFAFARAGQKKLPRFGTAMLVASGMAPDFDYASYFGGPSAFLRIHRTALHSLPGSAVMACAIAGAFCAAGRKFPQTNPQKGHREPLRFGPALAACGAGVAGHIVLDLVSGDGVQLLWPFHAGWFGWDLATNLDPWILVLLIAGLLLPGLFRLVSEEIGERRKAMKGQRGAIITLLLVVAYFGMRAELRGSAVDLLLSRDYHRREPLSAEAFPTPDSPFDWRGVIATDNTIEEIDASVAPGNDFDPDLSRSEYKPEDSPALDAGEATAAARTFLNYAKFPLATVARREDGYRFELHDLRFAPDDLSVANIFLRIDFDSGLRIMKQEFRFASSPGF